MFNVCNNDVLAAPKMAIEAEFPENNEMSSVIYYNISFHLTYHFVWLLMKQNFDLLLKVLNLNI